MHAEQLLRLPGLGQDPERVWSSVGRPVKHPEGDDGGTRVSRPRQPFAESSHCSRPRSVAGTAAATAAGGAGPSLAAGAAVSAGLVAGALVPPAPLVLPRKSVAYQPLPLSWKPAAVSCLRKLAAPQAGQSVRAHRKSSAGRPWHGRRTRTCRRRWAWRLGWKKVKWKTLDYKLGVEFAFTRAARAPAAASRAVRARSRRRQDQSLKQAVGAALFDQQLPQLALLAAMTLAQEVVQQARQLGDQRTAAPRP